MGTQSSRSTFGGPLGPNDNPGTGLELEAPLKFDHSSNMPFAVNGTGITFEPATKYDHSSNEPVLPLVYALELDKALGKSHAINDVVLDPQVMNAGYHGSVEADLLFGGPTLDASRGNMTLRTDKGLIADALNYGGLVDPWLSEGYHEDAGAGAEGAYARVPQGARGGGFGAPAVTQPAGPDLSTFRYPDGFDTDDNKLDFRTGQAMTIAAPAKVGDNNIKVTSVQGLSIGQIMYLGSGNSAEKVKIATVGTAGATTISADTPKGEIRIAVAGAQGFQAGQTVQIGSGTYVISAACVAAHSSTRALYKSYDGPLYQVMRQSDGKTLDIGVVQPSAGDPGGYADAEAQDRFCKDTYCWLTVIYDQSGKGNHLQQAPRGGFSGQAMGGFNNVPMADWAPVTIMGHKVYGVFITAGMGLRWNDAHGTAVDDQAEGQYWVINGNLYRRELDWMRRMPCARGGKARYRKESFHQLEERLQHRRDEQSVALDVKASYIGKKIFDIEHLSKAFGDKIILKDFTYIFTRYEKLGIIGENGVGKSTFLKLLLGIEQPDSGVIGRGTTLKIG